MNVTQEVTQTREHVHNKNMTVEKENKLEPQWIFDHKASSI